MTRLEDIKEQVQERLKDTWIKTQESSTFISLKERYDNLTHSAQRALKMGAICVGISFLFWFLLGLFSQSSEKLAEFEEYQDSIKQLLQLRGDMALTTSITPPPDPSILEQRVHTLLQSSYLSPDQIDEVSVKSPSTFVQAPGKRTSAKKRPSVIQQRGIWISLKSLNLKQITDIGFRLQTIHDSAKLIGLDMKASLEHKDYYDVMYTIIGFYPPITKARSRPNNKN